MLGNTYERTVAAALAETVSKFRLAEALAEEIPPRRPGPADKPVDEYLAEAREAIITAGGEPRSIRTLDDYRRTAQWVSRDLARDFAWVPGVSFSVHNEARKGGMTHAEFAANGPRTIDALRKFLDRPGTDGSPENVARSWTTEQQGQAAGALLTDPDVAAGAIAAMDPQARAGLARQAAASLPPADRARVAREAYDREARDADRAAAEAIRARLEDDAPVLTDPDTMNMQARIDASAAILEPVSKALTLLRPVPEAAEALGSWLSAESLESLHTIADEVIVLLEMTKVNADQAAAQETARKDT